MDVIKYKVMVNGHLSVRKTKEKKDEKAIKSIKNRIKNNYKRLNKKEPSIWIIKKI